MTYAVPSRARKSRALIERARPSRAERITPVEQFFFDADLYGRMSMESMGCSLDAVNGKYVEGIDGKWRGPFGADMPRLNGDTLSIAGEQYNAASCVKFDPQEGDESGFISQNGAGFGVEDKTESLAGTDFDTFKGNAYFVETITTATWGSVALPGGIGVIGDTVIAIVVLAPDGCKIKLNDGSTGGIDVPASSEWQLVKVEGLTPAQTWAKLSVGLNPSQKCWFILPHLLRQKFFESMIVGDNSAAPATFASEQGSADNGISAAKDDFPEIFAMLGGLVVDGNGNVRTPTGESVIDTSTILPSGTIAWGGTQIAGLTTGKLTVIEARVVGLASGETVYVRGGGNNDMSETITSNGPHVFTVQADADTNLKIFAPQGLTTDVTVDIVAKPVEAEGSMIVKWKPKFDYTDLPTSLILLTAGASSSANNSLLYLSYSSPGRIGSYNGSSYANSGVVQWSAGDEITIVLVWSPTTFRVYANGSSSTDAGGLGAFNLSDDRIVLKWSNEMSDEWESIEWRGYAMSQAEVEALNV